MDTNTKGQQMKTIEETAKEIWKQARAKDSDIELIEAGIVAGLRMAKEACDAESSHIVSTLMIDTMTTDRRNRLAENGCGVNRCIHAINSLIPTPAESAEKGDTQAKEVWQ